jgi:shikimate kinase/3-dehydroquinate synthase
LASVGLPAELQALERRLSAAALVGHMRRDKKVLDGALRFVLVRGIGSAFTAADVAAETVTDFLQAEGCAP